MFYRLYGFVPCASHNQLHSKISVCKSYMCSRQEICVAAHACLVQLHGGKHLGIPAHKLFGISIRHSTHSVRYLQYKRISFFHWRQETHPINGTHNSYCVRNFLLDQNRIQNKIYILDFPTECIEFLETMNTQFHMMTTPSLKTYFPDMDNGHRSTELCFCLVFTHFLAVKITGISSVTQTSSNVNRRTAFKQIKCIRYDFI